MLDREDQSEILGDVVREHFERKEIQRGLLPRGTDYPGVPAQLQRSRGPEIEHFSLRHSSIVG